MRSSFSESVCERRRLCARRTSRYSLSVCKAYMEKFLSLRLKLGYNSIYNIPSAANLCKLLGRYNKMDVPGGGKMHTARGRIDFLRGFAQKVEKRKIKAEKRLTKGKVSGIVSKLFAKRRRGWGKSLGRGA